MFSKQAVIYKSNFETRFCQLALLARKLRWDLYVCFWNDLQDMITAWWITWTTVLDYDTVAAGLSWGTGGELLTNGESS